MALKCLVFSEKSQKLPSGWGLRPQAPIGVNCYLARNLHNQQLSKSLLQGFGINKCCNDAAITAKPCLTITALTLIGYWLLLETFKPPPFKNFWVRPCQSYPTLLTSRTSIDVLEFAVSYDITKSHYFFMGALAITLYSALICC